MSVDESGGGGSDKGGQQQQQNRGNNNKRGKRPEQGRRSIRRSLELNLWCMYRVTLVVKYLGWVDLDLGCSTILLGQ